jgi:integrase
MGSLYQKKRSLKNKDGTTREYIEKVWWIKYSDHGKPIAESSGYTSRADAKRLLKNREGEIASGKRPGVFFDKVSLNSLLDDFLTDFRVNGKKSMDRAERSVGKLKEFFGNRRAPEITTDLIRRYIEKRQKDEAAAATINLELAAMKRSFNLGNQNTPPKVARVPYIPMLKLDNVRKGFFEHEGFLKLREVLPIHLKAPVTFAYFTGWRKEEVFGLTWDRVDLKERVVRLDPGTTKNNEGRTIYLTPEILDTIKAINRRLGCPYVFNRNGRRITDFRKAWAAACKAVGLDGMLFHDLRRSGVRNMVRAGIPERVAMLLSGHKTRSVFDRYNIVSGDDLKQAALKQESYLSFQAVQPDQLPPAQMVKVASAGGTGQLVELTGAWGRERVGAAARDGELFIQGATI